MQYKLWTLGNNNVPIRFISCNECTTLLCDVNKRGDCTCRWAGGT